MKPERSPERRKLEWQELIETALTAPGRMCDTYNRFYQYSFLNQLLVLMQGVREPVATYKRWQAIGRQVLKGSKAAEIVRPITIAKKNDDGEVEATFTRFKPVKCLFAYSQTEGEELFSYARYVSGSAGRGGAGADGHRRGGPLYHGRCSGTRLVGRRLRDCAHRAPVRPGSADPTAVAAG